MSWLVIACGVVLAAGGGYSIVSGAPYMQIEFGWTEVIAGTTALAGGVVTMALGAVLYRLAALQKAVVRAGEQAAAATRTPETALPAAPAPGLSGLDAARIAPRATDLHHDAEPVADAPPQPSLVSGWRSRFGSARKASDAVPVPMREPRIEAPAPLTGASAFPEPMPEAGLRVAGPADIEAESRIEPAEGHVGRVGIDDTGGREVVGRYEAGGASYALFSDGTIEVETATGMHRFASMEELKAFVERQDADKAALDL